MRYEGKTTRLRSLFIPHPSALIPSSVRVFNHCGFGHIDRQFADVRDVISDALDVFGDKEQARATGRRRRVADHQVNQVMKDTVIEIIYLVVSFDDGASRRRIALRESIKR